MAIPRTGQADCFDETGAAAPCMGSGQDGDPDLAAGQGVPWPEPRFEAGAEGIVRDRLTGLEWPEDASTAAWPMSWEEARSWVEGANARSLLGRADWRIPTMRELLYLTSPAHARPALPPGHPFRNIFQHWHWTSTPSAANPGHAWRVHLEGGRVFPGPVEAAHMVLPVRVGAGGALRVAEVSAEAAREAGRPWPEPRFEVSGGEALDRLTGLAWLADPQGGGERSWEEALTTARALGGGWRLPTIFELESLVDACRARPALPESLPFGEWLDGVWSSTSSGYDPAWAFVLYFGKGAVGVGHKPGRHFKFLLTRPSLRSRAFLLDSARPCG